MTDFRMDKGKPVSNNGGSHCRGNHDEVFNGTRLTPNGDWTPDDECMTRARSDRPWRPQGVLPKYPKDK